jgi:hypothetical protein
MRRTHRLCFAFAAILVVAAAASGQTGGTYDLSWSKISGGGDTFEAGGAYSLGETSGQPDAGTITGGTFTLKGGFWGGVAPACVAVGPSVTAPRSVVINATGVPASATAVGGATYAWILAGGTIASGQGTSQIQLDAGPPGTTMALSVDYALGGCTSPSAATRIQVDFLDVPPSDQFHDYVDTLARDGVTAGCGGGNFCRNSGVTRA